MAKPKSNETSTTAPQGAAADAPSESTAVAVKAETALSTEVMDLDDDDVGGGFENQGADDRKLTWLVVLQPTSPTVANGTHRVGDILDTTSGIAYDGKIGVELTPATTDQRFVLWISNDKEDGRPTAPEGSGFRGHFAPSDKFVVEVVKKHNGKRFGKLRCDTDKEPLDLVQTFYMPAIFHVPGTSRRKAVMIAHKSTHIPPYQELQTALSETRVTRKVMTPGGDIREEETTWPLYGYKIRMTSSVETKEKGGRRLTWFIPKYGPAVGDDFSKNRLTKADPAFIEAKALGKAYNAGLAKVDFAEQGAADGKSAAEASEDLPF